MNPNFGAEKWYVTGMIPGARFFRKYIFNIRNWFVAQYVFANL